MRWRQGDEIWEHKKGRIWLIIRKQELELRGLRYANSVLRARVSRMS